MSPSIPGKPVFPALPRLSSRGSTHTTVARGTALWESLVGKPRGKASRESHRSLDPREGKRDTAATAREESARVCPQSRRGLTPLGRHQKYPKVHVSTGEEFPLWRLEANHIYHLELPKGPSHPCCNSRSSPTYPSPLERKHESSANIQRSPVSAS